MTQSLYSIACIIKSLLPILARLSFADLVSFVNAVVILYAVLRALNSAYGSAPRTRPALDKATSTTSSQTVPLKWLLSWVTYATTAGWVLTRFVVSLMWNEVVPAVWRCGKSCFGTVIAPLVSTCIRWSYGICESGRAKFVAWAERKANDWAATIGLALFGEWVIEEDAGAQKARPTKLNRKGGKARKAKAKRARQLLQLRQEDEQHSEYDDALEFLPGSTESPAESSSPSQPADPSIPDSPPIAPMPQTPSNDIASPNKSDNPTSPILGPCMVFNTRLHTKPVPTADQTSILALVEAIQGWNLGTTDEDEQEAAKTRQAKGMARMALRCALVEPSIVEPRESISVAAPSSPGSASPASHGTSFDQSSFGQDTTLDTSATTPPAVLTPALSMDPLPTVADEESALGLEAVAGFESKRANVLEPPKPVDESEPEVESCPPAPKDRAESEDQPTTGAPTDSPLGHSASSPTPDAPTQTGGSVASIPPLESRSPLEPESLPKPRPIRKLPARNLISVPNQPSLPRYAQLLPETGRVCKRQPHAEDQAEIIERAEDAPTKRRRFVARQEEPSAAVVGEVEPAVQEEKKSVVPVVESPEPVGEAAEDMMDTPANANLDSSRNEHVGSLAELTPGLEYPYGGRPDGFGGPFMDTGSDQVGSFDSGFPMFDTLVAGQLSLLDMLSSDGLGLPTPDTAAFGDGLPLGFDHTTPFDSFMSGGSGLATSNWPGPGFDMDLSGAPTGSNLPGPSWVDKGKWPADDVNEVRKELEQSGAPRMGVGMGVGGSWMGADMAGAGLTGDDGVDRDCVMGGTMVEGMMGAGTMGNMVGGTLDGSWAFGTSNATSHLESTSGLDMSLDFLNDLPPADFAFSDEDLAALTNASDFGAALNGLGNNGSSANVAPHGQLIPGLNVPFLDPLNHPPLLMSDAELEALVNTPEFMAALEGLENMNQPEPRRLAGRVAGRERRAGRLA